jgi:Kelch motif
MTSWTNATVTINTIKKTLTPWNQPYLWSDSTGSSFYQWGGQRSVSAVGPNTAVSSLGRFYPDDRGGGEWTEQPPTSTSIFSSLRRGYKGAVASRGDTGYIVGGVINCGSDPEVDECCLSKPLLRDCDQDHTLGPIISYNSTSNSWTSDSVQDFSGTGTAIFSEMHNVPFGSSDGLNVIFGGGIASPLSLTSNGLPRDLLNFKHIYIYDPATKNFHNQTATGTWPSPRIRFCAVGTPGSNGSYEIFVYGGHDPSLPTEQMMLMSDQVFVLSLPGFVWFKADYAATNMRVWQTCDIVGQGKSQMVVVGGFDMAHPPKKNSDPWTNGINIFNLSAMRWEDKYEANDPTYQTPSVVRDWYISEGPYPSWDSPAVESLFNPAAALIPTSTSNPGTSPGTPPAGKNTNTGAIAGGVVGGIVSLVVIAFVTHWMLRKGKAEGRSEGYQKPELEANGSAWVHQPPFSGIATQLPELSATSVLKQTSAEERHEADSGSIKELHELMAGSTFV